MDELGHVARVALGTLMRPEVRHAISWAALAAVLADVAVALLLGPRGAPSLLATLSGRLRGLPGAVAVGVLHPLILGGLAALVVLAATRAGVVLRLWWASGVGVGLLLVALVLLDPRIRSGARRPVALLPLLLVGVALTGAARATY